MYDECLVLMKLLHTWIILVIAVQHLVQIGRVDGPTEYASYVLAVTELEQTRLLVESLTSEEGKT